MTQQTESEAKSISGGNDAVHTIYCFNNGGSPGWYSAMAIADDGYVLAQHICSHECFMAHDLGITSDWKHDGYDAHFGKGNWRLEWVDDPRRHKGLQAAYALNQELPRAETEADHKATRAGVSVVVSDTDGKEHTIERYS